MARPKTHPIKKVIGFDAEMLGRIREFRFEQRIDTESDAIRQLIEAGLSAADPIPVRNRKPKPVPGKSAPVAPKRRSGSSPPKAKALPMSKEAQIRALREQGAE